MSPGLLYSKKLEKYNPNCLQPDYTAVPQLHQDFKAVFSKVLHHNES